MFVPRYSEFQAREAVRASRSYAETLRRLGMCVTGGNSRTLRKYVEHWGISTQHFDPRRPRAEAGGTGPRPLCEILVPGSTYARGHLKERLYAEGLKRRICELCGQGEMWRGKRMSLILDHANGVSDDNRLENLRVVCPNCAATLPTHCGRKVRAVRACSHCAQSFTPRYEAQKYCSRVCAVRANCGGPRPERRKVERPPIAALLREVGRSGYRSVGRSYGVSDNTIRKWLRSEGVEPPRGTWPNRRPGGASRPGSAPRRARGRGRAGPRRSR